MAMDPPPLVSKVALQEVWPLPLAAAEPGGLLGMHTASAGMVLLGHNAGFAEVGGHRGAASAEGSTVTEHSGGMRTAPAGMALLGHNAGFAEVGGHRGAASAEGSTVTEDSGGIRGSWRKRRDVGAGGAAASEDGSYKGGFNSSGEELTDCEAKCPKTRGLRGENGVAEAVEERSGICSKLTNQSAKPDAPKQDYIHVRARRGQATDSHSLAERARREKISKRMKFLQDLVPGCNKIIGKALVLDEIINYIQSLQHQVKFLSMKLEAINAQMNPSIERLPGKDAFDTTFGLALCAQPTREHGRGSRHEWLHMQVGGGGELRWQNSPN